MAYINIETKDVDYRLLLTHHSLPVEDSEISPNLTGLIIEGGGFSYERLFDYLTGREKNVESFSKVVEHPLKNLFKRIRRGQIPVVSAEPLSPLSTTKISRLEEEFNRETQAFKGRERYLDVINRIKRYGGEISPDDQLIKDLEETEGVVSQLRHGDVTITLRSLVMAQRSFAFGRHQRENGVERPCLNIATGSLHVGIRRYLEMNEDERVRSILVHPSLFINYSRDDLAKGFYVIYEQAGKLYPDWHQYTFEDSALREIK
jgi:hypothetical protein